MTEDLPLALRRSRRSINSAACPSHVQPTPPQTPSRSSARSKRVHFSTSDLLTNAKAKVDDNKNNNINNTAASTGLTPFIRRTTLTPGLGSSSSSKKRRYSGPAATDHTDVFNPYRDTGYNGQVTFTPLRQVLDGRVKRRIRRNGLSEEMHSISAEKKRRTQRTQAEMDTLRAELAAKDAEIRRLSGETEIGDEHGGEGVDDLKREVEKLRRNLNRPAPAFMRASSVDSDATEIDWSRSTQGEQVSGDCLQMDVDFDDNETIEDHVFSDETMAELACSTPSRRATHPRHSFPTPPSTSPRLRLRSPVFSAPITPTSHASVQVRLPDPNHPDVEDELASLHLEVEKLTHTLSTYESLTTRLSSKLAPYSPAPPSSAAEAIQRSRSPALQTEAQLNTLLRTLSERTTALTTLQTSLSGLGFPGTAPSDIITALRSAFRAARLELEYLEPGESALPLTAAGAEVLDLLLTRLRELARQNLEKDDVIDEYSEAEASLRTQLSARVEAMDAMRVEIGTLKEKVKLRNMRIKELESGMEKLRASVKGYTSDIADLEALAQRLEGELDEARKAAGKEAEEGLEAEEGWLGAIKRKDTTAVLLEGRLAHALNQVAELKAQLAQQQDAATVNQHDNHEGDAVLAAERENDTKVAELRAEVEEVSEALRQARETVATLRGENGVLEEERARAKSVFDTMRAEMERAVRMGVRLMATPPPNSPVEK
ncbi:hypothetical protein N0V93_007850 [Gnomoniopsis smithogilvyi]|uniref:Uncharacterized protein n=1 Tax=Gnomoniopsis smithogilvyi TaxID=1191159 RepID=A0A9W8YM34_9PEZI|nr:hypothetical protein N0V93_007850 [Gnomoniopsis smithogilvyi]